MKFFLYGPIFCIVYLCGEEHLNDRKNEIRNGAPPSFDVLSIEKNNNRIKPITINFNAQMQFPKKALKFVARDTFSFCCIFFS